MEYLSVETFKNFGIGSRGEIVSEIVIVSEIKAPIKQVST